MKMKRLILSFLFLCFGLLYLTVFEADCQTRALQFYTHEADEIGPLPPGVMPVVFLKGKPYEMGHQYGTQLMDYIVRVKDSLWGQLLKKEDKATVLKHLLEYDKVIRNEAPEMIPIMRGMAAGARVDYDDILMINCFVDVAWARPVESCSGLAAWGSATKEGKTIAGINFDFTPEPFSYRAVVIAYPEEGNSFISTGYAGVLGNNFTMNDKGLVELNNHGEYIRPQDKGYGLPAMLIPGYIAMTCSTWEEARDFMLKSTISMGVVRHFQDTGGGGCVVESTADKSAVRYSGDFGEKDYLIDTNHWLTSEMEDTKWPMPRPGNSEYRYMSVEKFLQDNHGNLDVSSFMEILGIGDRFWDGKEWQVPEGWSKNTVNCLSEKFGTHASQIAVPADKTVYIRTGDATGMWGTLAPNESGEFVTLALNDNPEAIVAAAIQAAQQDLWRASEKVFESGDIALMDKLNRVKKAYWRAQGYFVKASNQGGDDCLATLGKAASQACKAQAYSKMLIRLSGAR